MRSIVFALAALLSFSCSDESSTDPDPVEPDAEVEPVACVPADWRTELIDADMMRGGFNQIAVDDAGNISVAYGRDYQLYYAERGDTAWTVTPADVSMSRSNVHPAHAIAPDGSRHIVYAENTRNQLVKLEHHELVGDEWVATTITEYLGGSAIDPHYVIDSDGGHHLTFFTTDSMRYAYRTPGGAWTVDTLQGSTLNEHAPIAIDSDGALHLSHEVESSYELGYAFKSAGGEWEMEIVDDTPGHVPASAIAIDRDGNVYVAYSHEAGSRLELGRRDAATGEWSFETIDEGAAFYVDLMIDGDDNLVAIYHRRDPPESEVVHAERPLDSTDWTRQIIDANEGFYVTAALSPPRTLHVAYYEFAREELRYAVRDCL